MQRVLQEFIKNKFHKFMIILTGGNYEKDPIV